jgi:hypothetical protein
MKFNHHYPFIYPVLFLIVGLTSCELINPAETIPARIQLNEFVLEIPANQGTSRQKITEVWTLANGSFIGAFDPPTEIRYITEQALTSFIFRPGIRNNGILDDAIPYPMMTGFEADINTTPGTLTEITPIFRYKPEVVVSLIADFETQNDFADNRDTVIASQVVRTDQEPFEGNFSGEMLMTPEAHFIEVGHTIAIGDLPTDGTPAYLEFHYKSETEMSIGLLGIPLSGPSSSNFFYVVRPSENWNKLYIDLTDRLEESGFTSYKVLFRSIYPGGSQSSYKILLDNIKVLHL